MSKRTFISFFWVALFGSIFAANPVNAIFLGQIDDFSDGTTGNWAIGNASSPFAPVNISSGGPFDATESPDAFLQLSSSGTMGAGSKLVSFNINQWTGDFFGAGVTGISLDLNNLGSNPVTFRLALAGAESTFGSNQGFSLTPGTGWQQATFDFTASDFTQFSGTATFEQAFAGVTELRLLSSTNPAFSGETIAATVGVDNIQAIPEPSTLMLSLTGVMVLIIGYRIPAKLVAKKAETSNHRKYLKDSKVSRDNLDSVHSEQCAEFRFGRTLLIRKLSPLRRLKYRVMQSPFP